MDYSAARERRRTAAASRRAARSGDNSITNYNNNIATNNGGGGGFHTDEDHQQQHNYSSHHNHHHGRIKNSSSPHRQPLEKSFLSSLSQALTNIDRHNNDYFSSSTNRLDDHALSSNNGLVENKNRDGDDNVVISFSNNSSQHPSPYNNHNNKYTKQKTIRPTPPTNFASYLKFTTITIYTLLLFTSCYFLVLFCTLPMISYTNINTPLPTDDTIGNNEHHIQQGASFTHIRGHQHYQQMKQQLGTLKERAVQWEQNAKLNANKVEQMAHERAVQLQEKERYWIDSAMDKLGGDNDASTIRKMSQLLQEAVEEYEGEEEGSVKENTNQVVRGQDEHWLHALESWDQVVATEEEVDKEEEENEGGAMNNPGNKKPGFIVLGMHRSGTSMLSGLLVEGFGYETGGPLIMPNFDNEKGFYERIDVVLQNDEFFRSQNMGWSFNVINYDSDKALRDKLQSRIKFDEGKRALQFLNNHQKTLPYLQKDPRMCIALPTWLKLLDDEPAIVFTYRHPLEVAMSLKKREGSITLEHGLRLWIVYNMRAIQNSVGLCRVFSTNEAVMKDPAREVQRIKNQLTDTCHVLPPPTSLIPQKVVDSFIDPNLQHNSNERKKEEKTSSILKDFGGGCVAKEFDSDYEKGSSNYEAEKSIFLMAMQIFCDFENGKAYEVDYEWPDLVHWQRPARVN